MNIMRLVLLLLVASFSVSCARTAGSGGEGELDELDDVEMNVLRDELTRHQEDFRWPQVYERNVGLHARSEGPELIVSAHNRGSEGVAVTHQDLALIVGPNPETDLVLINPQTADVRAFTPMILAPGEHSSRRVRMLGRDNLRGTRLVYRNTRQNIQFFVMVE